MRPGNDANDANNAAPPPGLSAAAARRDEAAEEVGEEGESRATRLTLGKCFVDRIIILFHRGTNYTSKSNTFHLGGVFQCSQNEIAIVHNKF